MIEMYSLDTRQLIMISNDMPELVGGPVKHLINEYKGAALRWWIKCKYGHLQMVNEDQVRGNSMIYCSECSSGFYQDFTKHTGFREKVLV